MGDRKWGGPSHFDASPDSYGDGLKLPLAARVLRETIQQMRALTGRPRVDGVEELLDALRRLSALEREIKAQRSLLIAELLARGGTWQKAADACGRKKQSLHKAHHSTVDALSGICNGASSEKALRVMQLLHPEAVRGLVAKGHIEFRTVSVNGRPRVGLYRNPGAVGDAERFERSAAGAPAQPAGRKLRSVPLPRRARP